MDGFPDSGGPCCAAGLLPRPSRSSSRTPCAGFPPFLPLLAQASTLYRCSLRNVAFTRLGTSRTRRESPRTARVGSSEQTTSSDGFSRLAPLERRPPHFHLPALTLGVRRGVVAKVVSAQRRVRAYEWCSDCSRRLAPCSVHRTVDGQSPLSPCPLYMQCCLRCAPSWRPCAAYPFDWERSA